MQLIHRSQLEMGVMAGTITPATLTLVDYALKEMIEQIEHYEKIKKVLVPGKKIKFNWKAD